jgi:hypothetical protein
MTSDCEKLKKCSRYVKTWINEQPAIKEESITDWLLYYSSKIISRITYRAFTRTEEARNTGADWEWWFLLPRNNIKFRVQAKKINPIHDNYPSIARTNRYGLQIKKLLSDADSTNSIPLYAFYTDIQSTLNCKQSRGKGEGVFLAGAKQIYLDFLLNGIRNIKPGTILSKCIPLSCILCCPLNREPQNGFEGFLREYFTLETVIIDAPKNNNDRSDLRGIYSSIPSYIQQFLNQKEQVSSFDWETEYRGDIEDINALVVYDARNLE